MSEKIMDLRTWLAAVDELGELKRVREEVDWDEEMGAIAYMVGKQTGGPALLFEKVKDYSKDYQVLFNMLGSSANRIALAMELPAGLGAMDLIKVVREKFKNRIPPREIPHSEAPVNENVLLGDDV